MAAVFLEVSVLLPEELRLEPGPAVLPGGCVFVAFYGAWFISAWIIIATTRRIFNKTSFDGKMLPPTAPLTGQRKEWSVYKKYDSRKRAFTENCFLKQVLKEGVGSGSSRSPSVLSTLTLPWSCD